jgi:8-oxo-dGTP pyrophosphatase MutT (NUDIX family)
VKARIARVLKDTVPASDPVAAALDYYPADTSRALFPKPLINSAVLVPIVLHADAPTVLLTRRTDHLRDHPGQIGFPGGRVEPEDAGPLEAALREVDEELGLSSRLVEVAGYLQTHAVVTGFAVTPVVGFVPPGQDLRPDPFEVADVFEVPLGYFMDEANLAVSVRTINGVELPVFEYRYEDRRIWGATALMLRNLILIINKNN